MQFTLKHALLFIIVPITFLIAQILFELFLPQSVLNDMHSEKGTHEILQALIIFTGFLIGISILLSREIRMQNPLLIGWIALATLCCLYVSGEETSWGQHIFNWSTPDYWAAINDQRETNIHNMSSWFDQKPRLMLELGVIIGGIIIPLLLRLKPKALPEKFSIIYPTIGFIVTALIFTVLKIADQMEDYGFHFMTRISEVEEIFIFYFVTLYMMLMRRRINTAD